MQTTKAFQTLHEIADKIAALPIAEYEYKTVGGEQLLSVSFPDGYIVPTDAVVSLPITTVVLVEHPSGNKVFQAQKRNSKPKKGFSK